MCGIIGYTGKNQAESILLQALETLEYRGYDSAGIAIMDEKIEVRKCAGRVADLRKVCATAPLTGSCGIGHTRWATHGGVTDGNAHPHKRGKVTLVHNGIIENYAELIERYDLVMESDTDTEVAAACLDRYYQGDVFAAFAKLVRKIKGTFALVVMFEDKPGVIYAIRHVSPVVVGVGAGENILASDIIAVSPYTKSYFVVPELHITELREGSAKVYDLQGQEVEQELLTIDWDTTQDGKGGYPFYMEKEIMEQPDAISRTVDPRLVGDTIDFSADQIPDELLTECKRICIIACGTAMHAGLVGKSLIQRRLGIKVEVEIASEFLYTHPVIEEGTLVVAVSQSGETIDTLEALKYAQKEGAKALAIVNVKESSIARTADYVIYTNAGPEIAVASTKAYTTQVAIFYLLTCKMARLAGKMTAEEEKAYVEQIRLIPEKISKVLEDKGEIHKITRSVVEAKDAFMIGRGLDYAALLEASLKLKEVAYVHSEAYASGELKHGTIALITEETPVVALVTQTSLRRKEMLNIKEVQSRGAKVIGFIKSSFLADSDESSKVEDFQTYYALPDMEDEFMIMPATVALQLLAYYTSADRGLDVDKPRNLAKVVTVE